MSKNILKKVLVIGILSSSSLYAHTAIMSCFDNGDGTVVCEGGFSDGSSASGVLMYLKQKDKKILESRMNEDSEFTFTKPKDAYTVHFDAGQGHLVTINGEDISE